LGTGSKADHQATDEQGLKNQPPRLPLVFKKSAEFNKI
jgi:hypothetical protein